jgi:hypothetical protein
MGSRAECARLEKLARHAPKVAALIALAALSAPALFGAIRLDRSAFQPAQVEAAEPTEYELKAVFLFRFATPYVKWPATAFSSKTAPFVITIVGKDPFGKSIDDLLAGKKVGEHPIQIVRKASVEELENCHLLFVPQSQEKHLEKVREFTKDKPILVVAESIAAAKSGAHVGFYLERAHVRFAINPTAAKQAKLDVSSELLKLAMLVESKPEGGR